MTDRVRAALFNILGPVSGARVLDVFAGSGAIGLEALSRGAGSLVVVENNRQAVDTIRANAASLGAEITLIPRALEAWMPATDAEFDLIVADPPYAKIDAYLLQQLARLVAPQGRLVISHSSLTPSPTLQSMQFVKSSSYGDSTLSFYVR
jgi:16S rRNA (guanine966-N2)-methyltransferase